MGCGRISKCPNSWGFSPPHPCLCRIAGDWLQCLRASVSPCARGCCTTGAASSLFAAWWGGVGMVVPERPAAIPLPQLFSSCSHWGQWDENPLGVDLNPNSPAPVIWGSQEQPVGWGREKPCTCSQRGFSSSPAWRNGWGDSDSGAPVIVQDTMVCEKMWGLKG